jgi:hypothetical protein
VTRVCSCLHPSHFTATRVDFMSTLLHVRIPNELEERLDERRRNADLNVSAFVRRVIERELDRPVVEAEPERRSVSLAPVLVATRKQVE